MRTRIPLAAAGMLACLAAQPASAQSQTAEATKKATPFTEQEWYINAKVAQLKGQIYTYSNFPSLDPSGAIMDSLTNEVNELVGKQQAKLRKANAEAAAKQAELDKLEEEKKNAPMTADQLIERAKLRAEGKEPQEAISKEVQALLDKSKGAIVDQTV